MSCTCNEDHFHIMFVDMAARQFLQAHISRHGMGTTTASRDAQMAMDYAEELWRAYKTKADGVRAANKCRDHNPLNFPREPQGVN